MTEPRRHDSRTRVVIADDEPLARQRIRALLADREDIIIADEARDGAEAVDVILRERPDVVFLDVKMPELDGFEVIAALDAMGEDGDTSMPAIVFVTAYGEFARVRAMLTDAPSDAVLTIRVDGAMTQHASQLLSAAHLRSLAPPTMNVEVRPANP